jgi:hypothetical protein
LTLIYNVSEVKGMKMTLKEAKEKIEEMKELFNENSEYIQAIEIASSAINYLTIGQKLANEVENKER